MEKRRDIRNFYIDEQFIPIWEKFKEICKREDQSVSAKIRGFIARYVAIHEKGNPQLLLDSFIDTPKMTCFGCEGHFQWLHKVKFISGLVRGVCDSCLENYQRRTVVKKVLGVIGRKK